MKNNYSKFGIILMICILFISCNQTKESQSKVQTENKSKFTNLSGPYLGQNPPGMIPEVFAPGIISKTGNHLHSCVNFSPDGKEIYFTYRAYEPVRKNTIYYMRETEKGWAQPLPAPFSGVHDDDSPAFSANGKQLFFNSSRPIDDSDKSNDLNFWYVEKIGSDWSEPVYAGDVLNTDSCDFRLSISKNERMYLSSDRAYQGRRAFDVFVSEFVNGTYSNPEKMGDAITSSNTEQVGFIAPDESYIVFYRYPPTHPEGVGLYISFRREDGAWTKGKNMGTLFNAPAESCTQAASLSPDGKYMFFLRRYDEAIYWVDAKVIENLKPDYLK